LSLDTNEIKAAIKLLMKRKRVNYHDLAKHLQVSHATVKRFLTSEELSLSRLLVICDWLGLSLSDLETLASTSFPKKDETYTPAQEEFLSSDPKYLVYLNCLYAGMNPSEIEKSFNLNKRSTDKYLLRLEQHELIKVTEKGLVKPASKTQPSWRTGGLLAKTHYKCVISTFAQFFIDSTEEKFSKETFKDPTKRVWGNLTCSPMSKKNADAMITEVEAVINRWAHVASLEEKIEGEQNLGRIVQMTCLSWQKDKAAVKVLENVFGDVEPLY
jgi:DNA-binding Xre family transcriptional regulator